MLLGEAECADSTPPPELSDILLHLIRNAIDHGIESPAERKRGGKNPIGNITIGFYLQARNLVLEIRDDGAGINTDRLCQRAQSLGVLSGSPISEAEKIQLIFLPGLSSKAEVTTISGRGIGMDVVKTLIFALSGEIKVVTDPGHGTSFSVTLPLRDKIKSAA